MQLTFLEEAPAEADVDYEDGVNHTLRGFAAEHLVAADLMFSGFNCSLSSPMSAFDLAVEAGDSVLRVQVKSASRPRKLGSYLPGYVFGDGSDGPLRDYAGRADVFAFVATDIRRVLYAKVPDVKRRAVIPADSFSKEACDLSRKLCFG